MVLVDVLDVVLVDVLDVLVDVLLVLVVLLVLLVSEEGWLAGGQIPPFWQASIEQQPLNCL